MLRLGLTGGIGSGKSTVASMLVAHGAVLIDADAISRATTATGGRQVPIYSVKSGTIPQITRTLRRMLHMDDPGIPEADDMRLFAQNGSDDEVEALEEARLAVEQIVIDRKSVV